MLLKGIKMIEVSILVLMDSRIKIESSRTHSAEDKVSILVLMDSRIKM